MSEVKEIQMKGGTSWSPNNLAFITGLLYETSTELSEGFLRVTGLSQSRENQAIWPNNDKEFILVKIDFIGIGNLKLSGFGSGKQQVMGFSIHDVRKHGLEGITYEIEDYEDGIITFHCRDIVVTTE